MTKFLVIFLLVWSIPAFAEMPHNYPNEPDGFRGIKWGDNIKHVKGMELDTVSKDDKDTVLYKRSEDSLIMGDAKLRLILYGAWRDKFNGVIITFGDRANWDKLKAVLFERFGPGSNQNYMQDSFERFGDKTVITIEYNDVSGEGTLIFRSKKIAVESEAYIKKRAKENASKGF